MDPWLMIGKNLRGTLPPHLKLSKKSLEKKHPNLHKESPPSPPSEKQPEIVYSVDPVNFRSLVQHLTRLVPSPLMPETSTVTYSSGVGKPSSSVCSNETIEDKLITSEFSLYEGSYQCISSIKEEDEEEEEEDEECSVTVTDKAYQEMLRRIKSINKKEYSLSVSSKCLDCVVFLKLFPVDYVIDHDTLIQLWMAEGLITEEPMEEIADAYLKALIEHGELISMLKEDYSTGRTWYKVTEFILPQKVLEMSSINPLRVVSEYLASVFPVKPVPCHVILQDLPKNGLKTLAQYAHIKAISLLKDHKSQIEHVPYDFFISLKCLHTLNLRGTRISELPSSIGNAASLRFLDLSETLIRRLPETIDALECLQTLKLQNCTRLATLPKGIRRLTSLRHLEFSTPRNLRCMPPGMGALTRLRTLSEFIAGNQHGCLIDELKVMNELGGKLCLSKLERVTSVVEAKEANLSCKQRLKKLELRWSDNTEEEGNRIDDKVIEYIRPHTNLQELRILHYSGSVFPSWISHPSFTKLVNITLFKCENCHLLPSLGQLPSLESLSLIEMTGVEIIDFRFCKDEPVAHVDDQFSPFPVLQKLEIKSMLSLKEWRDMGTSSFPRLIKLFIRDCPKLTTVCKLSSITALEYIELNQCTSLPSLPAGDMPASVKTLVIESCRMLSLTSSMDDAQDWHKTHQDTNLIVYQRKEKQGIDG